MTKAQAGRQLIFALCLLAVAVAGYLLTRSAQPQLLPVEPAATTTPATTTTSSPAQALSPEKPATKPAPSGSAIEGTYVCLPHRDAGGPQTLECALGLKADDGSYYALSSPGALAESSSATTPTGARVRVTGSVESLSASDPEWQKYAVVGVIRVASFTRL